MSNKVRDALLLCSGGFSVMAGVLLAEQRYAVSIVLFAICIAGVVWAG